MSPEAILKTDVIILGQGLAGSALAWRLHWAGQRILIIDRGESITASRIAAGLMTPITGRRMTKADDYDLLLAEAESFYREVEASTGRPLLDNQPSVRFLVNAEERKQFVTERLPHLQHDVRLIRNLAGEISGFEMLNSARLRVASFLSATRDYFSKREEYVTADVEPSDDIELSNDGVHIAKLRISAKRLVFCQGYQRQINPWFPGVPDAASKGEILTVRLKGRKDQRVTHHGVWLAPADGMVTASAAAKPRAEECAEDFIVGATYNRDDLSNTITASAREELLSGLAALVSEPVEVLDQVAAVRAGMKHRRPVFAVHAEHPGLATLNGLGSRGALLAPSSAKELTGLLLNRSPSPPGKKTRRKSLTQLAHNIIRRVLSPGDSAIDATAGNGHDTLFLASLVGEKGCVIAIDLQPDAIAATQHKLSLHGIRHVKCRLKDHGTELNRLAEEHISAKVIMFNLGYLPGSDKTITTIAETTVSALRAAQCLLSPGGVITAIAYRGHAGGQDETAAIEDLIHQQTATDITVDRIDGDEGNETSPVLFVWRRK